MPTNAFFQDFTITPDLLLHRVSVRRADESHTDVDGAGTVGTDANPHVALRDNWPALVDELSADEIEAWGRLEIKASHTVYFDHTLNLDLRINDLIVVNNRTLVVTAFKDPLQQGIVPTAVCYELR